MSLLSILQTVGEIKHLFHEPNIDKAKTIIASAKAAIEELSDHYKCAKDSSLEYLSAISFEHETLKHDLYKYYTAQSHLISAHLKHEQLTLILGSDSLEGNLVFTEKEFKLACIRSKAPVTFFEAEGSHYLERALSLGQGFKHVKPILGFPLFDQVCLDFKRTPLMIKTGGAKLYGSFSEFELEDDIKAFTSHLKAQLISPLAILTAINLIHQSHAAPLYGYLFSQCQKNIVPIQSYGSYKIEFEATPDRGIKVKYAITYLHYNNHSNVELPYKFPCTIEFMICPDGIIMQALYHIGKFNV